MRILLLAGFFLLAGGGKTVAKSYYSGASVSIFLQENAQMQDTTNTDSLKKVQLLMLKEKAFTKDLRPRSVTKDPDQLALYPAISLQQSLKAQAPGLFIQESSGEPGTVQQMYVRGISTPLLSKRDVYQSQPLVVLDGMPLITDEHPFAYDLQRYDYNRMGPATNLLASIDINNIERIEILKDMAGLAYYGPRAANGVILLTSKKSSKKSKISFNSYVGMAQRPSVTTINGEYENNFRKQFYDRYTPDGTYNDDDVYPLYLSDSLSNAYYGPSNWTDSYYKNALVYGIHADISGGSDRAGFRFAAGNTKSDGVADDTGMDRYNAFFSVNIKPLKWMQFTAMVNGTRLNRMRNRSLRDRFAQMNYIPELSAPLAPNKEAYNNYLSQFDKGFDNNFNNVVQGQGRLVIDFGDLKFVSKLGLDYSEGFRDLFFPRTLMDEISYASNYYGFNQRLLFDNTVSYTRLFNDKHLLNFEAGTSTQWDTYKYNNGYAYKGINDFIKLNLLETDPNNGSYLLPLAFPRELVYKFLDRTKQNLLAFYAKAEYSFDDKYNVSLLLRTDGSSNAQPTSRWLFTPAVAASWNIKQDLLADRKFISELNFRVSAGRAGRLNTFDNFSQGPQYTAEAGYTGNLTAPGFNGFAVLNRPYSFGWVGYGIPWAYTDQLNVGLDFSFADHRFRASVDAYTKNDKNQLLGIPTYAEYGYEQAYETGLNVNNKGIDLILSADVLKSGKRALSWTSTLNFNVNRNRLTSLPGQRSEIVIGNRLLQVGKPIDQYWLLTNNGIYESDSQVPGTNGQKMTYNGIALSGGDPMWKDLNNDNRIDYNDKSLMGHIMPKLAGGFNNQFRYKNWDLGIDLYFNLGRKLINEEMANRFNFINREGTLAITSVKEITFWEKRGDYSKYPLYNPWSTVIPYRSDQSLFLENASFLKLRTVSVGYDLSALVKSKKIERLYLYGSANNVFTITPYTGQDPELVDYTGYDTGYGLPIPRTYTLGVRMNL